MSDNETLKQTAFNQGSALETIPLNVSLAVKYGLDESIILSFFIHMISQHKRMKRNSFQGRTWNYCSRREISAYFPFWTEKEIRTRLDRMVAKGIILKRSIRQHSWNKQNFYAFANEQDFGFVNEIEKHDSKNSYVGPNGPTSAQTGQSMAQTGQSKQYNTTISNQDIDKDNILEKTLPSSIRSKKENISSAKRWKLSPDQEIIYEWLKGENINTEDKTLCFWAKTYTAERLCEVVEYAKKTCKTNLGGLVNSILLKNLVVPNDTSQCNREFVSEFIKRNHWVGLEVLERYVKIYLTNGHFEELPYNLDSIDFTRKIELLYELTCRRKPD